jgi:hypothetical protein
VDPCVKVRDAGLPAQLVHQANAEREYRGGRLAMDHHGVADAPHELDPVLPRHARDLAREADRHVSRCLVSGRLAEDRVVADVREKEAVELLRCHLSDRREKRGNIVTCRR